MPITICRLYDSYADARRVTVALDVAGLPSSETSVISNNSDAWYEATSRYWYYRPLAPMVFRDALGRPVFARPYGYASDPFGDPLLEEARLAQFCMRNKGYELAPVER